jgi:zinc resistance-associated protein
MQSFRFAKAVAIVIGIAVIFLGVQAFAHREGGNGRGWHHRGYGGSGFGRMMDGWNDETTRKLQDQEESFYNETEDLKQKLYERELALEGEMIKKDPNSTNVMKLQKEISDLDGQLEEKRMRYMLEFRKNNSEAGWGRMRRGGMEYGRSFGGGACWR